MTNDCDEEGVKLRGRNPRPVDLVLGKRIKVFEGGEVI
jgi:hypothetical protein